MGLLSRRFDPGQSPPPPPERAAPQDDVPTLVVRTRDLVVEINRAAGDLPPLGVVLARSVTDTVLQVLRSSQAPQLDISVRVAINAVLTDYLPSTIRRYVSATRSADPASRARADDQLVEQLAALRGTVDEIAEADRRRDLQALEVHGRFLETKFARSDLDL